MIKNSRFFVVYILIIATGLYINLYSEITVPINRSLKELPLSYKGWKMVSESIFDENILEKLRPTDYVLRRYVGSEKIPVYLYVGYHGGGNNSGEIHSPRHCLPGSGWLKIKEDKISINSESGKINLVKAIYQKGEEKELFFYWYKVRGETLSSEFALKFTQIINSMLYRRKDAAFIRVSVPFESDENIASSVGIKFIKDFYPVIERFLP
jgi:EpsI family protein